MNDLELSRFQHFISDVEALLPNSMKPYLTESIELKFKDFSKGNSEKNFYLRPIECFYDTKTKNQADDEGQKGGETIFHSSSSSIITLNKLFWPEILKGSKSSISYNCGLKSTYRLALSTFLHQLALIYDSKVKISSDRRFRHLMTFSKSFVFFTNQKNNSVTANSDELSSPKEAFAVNLGYFLLDPEYQCRRPTIYNYYREKLDIHPFPKPTCKINRMVNVMGRAQKTISLDLERFYRADYFLAAAGQELVSLFGHSMLRLIFCAPGVPLNEDCAIDSRYHVIISFRANVVDKENVGKIAKDKNDFWSKSKDFFMDSWLPINHMLKGLGLNGSYPSKMFLMSPDLVLSEYNNYYYRDVISTPLYLSEIEKRDLLNRVLEINSGYEGSYQFFTNNCLSETEDLIKAVVRDNSINNLNGLTPVKLRDAFYEIGLSRYSDLKKEAPDLGEMTFTSLHHALSSAAEDLKKKLKASPSDILNSKFATFLIEANFKKPDTMKIYTKNFTAEDRRNFIYALKNNYENSRIYQSLLADFLALESGALQFVSMNYFINDYLYRVALLRNIEDFKEHISPKDIELIKNELSRITAAQKMMSLPGLEHKTDVYPEMALMINNLIDMANARHISELKVTKENIQLLNKLSN
mgnify:FL=1